MVARSPGLFVFKQPLERKSLEQPLVERFGGSLGR